MRGGKVGDSQDEWEVVEYISAIACHSNRAGELFGTFVLTGPYPSGLALTNNELLKRKYCVAGQGSKASPEIAPHPWLDWPMTSSNST